MCVAFVPTMGYLHEGHLSLVQRARKAVGAKSKVVVSIFVNPTQFAPNEDLKKYPRDLRRDKQLCKDAGVDVVFIPSDKQMYPEDFSTFVSGRNPFEIDGRRFRGHRIFEASAPLWPNYLTLFSSEFRVFGAKDFQQAAMVQRMVRDLNFPVKSCCSGQPYVRRWFGDEFAE